MKKAIIELGGEKRELKFTTGAKMALEEKTGINTLGTDWLSSLNARTIVIAVWAMLLHKAPNLRLDQVTAWLHSDRGDESNELWRHVTEGLLNAYILSNGKDPDEVRAQREAALTEDEDAEKNEIAEDRMNSQ